MRLADLLVVGRAPDYPVAWLDDRLVTWADFSARVRGLAGNLATRSEQNWLLACPEPYEFAVALFAVWQSGGRALLPPSLREGAIEAVRADGVLADLATFAADGDFALIRLDPERCGLDLFTSGSSGEPKRVAKSLAQLDAEVAVLDALWGDDARPVLATVPHHHIYGLLFRVLWPLVSGRAFDNQTCTAPEILLGRLAEIGPGPVVSSPAQLARMHELIALGDLAGRASRIYSSGGPLPAEAAARFLAALGRPPLEILGSTETGGIAWREQINDAAWTPLPGVAVTVSGEGALSLTSPFLADAAPLATGDAAEALADGRFRLLGRLDRIAKIEEKRLSLPDMETRLAGHPWVSEAALAVLDGRRRHLGALVVLSEDGRQALARDGRAACAQALRRHLGHWFEPVLLPRRWRYADALPYNERGKLAVADLAAHFDESGDD